MYKTPVQEPYQIKDVENFFWNEKSSAIYFDSPIFTGTD
jgi:hypothetical protein